jgi:hypothetical protein
MTMRPISYTRATDVAGAITTVSADPKRAFLAGGTTEIDLLRLNVVQPDSLVDINGLPLQQIDVLADGGLRIAVMQQKQQYPPFFLQVPQQLTCLLRHPGYCRVLSTACKMNATRADLDEEEHIHGFQLQGFYGKEVTR